MGHLQVLTVKTGADIRHSRESGGLPNIARPRYIPEIPAFESGNDVACLSYAHLSHLSTFTPKYFYSIAGWNKRTLRIFRIITVVAYCHVIVRRKSGSRETDDELILE